MKRLALSCSVRVRVIVAGLAATSMLGAPPAARSQPLLAAEFVELTPQSWDAYAPDGKEVDCIYGDWVLQNPWVKAVIAQPTASRNANMTVRGVAGCLIDLTSRLDGPESDQLSAYYPAGDGLADGATMLVVEGERHPVASLGAAVTSGEKIEVVLKGIIRPGRPSVEVSYTLGSGDRGVLVTTTYANPHSAEVEVVLADSLRADGEFRFREHPALNLFVAEDSYWRQAYGIQSLEATLQVDAESRRRGRPVLNYERGGQSRFTLKPRESVAFRRWIQPAASSLALLNDRLLEHHADAATQLEHGQVVVRDPDGPLVDAQVQFFRGDDSLYAQAYSPGKEADGTAGLEVVLPPENPPTKVRVTAPGRAIVVEPLRFGDQLLTIDLPRPGAVVATITDDQDQPIPAKVAFYGREGTPDPNFGPDSAIDGVRNVQYTANGQVQAAVPPGSYEVVVSHGPEFDATVSEITVRAGETTQVAAQLAHPVDSSGWLSADFHSHSTPSGDNTSHQRGRVLNLLAEHIEFGPCTEHNRIETYVPHLKHYDAVDRMATCTGMELTGRPLPVNHQNAFPLVHHSRLQDGGGPVTDENPVTQIERLALWDEASEKLVQSNHPNIPLIYNDRDYDGVEDGGFERMLGFMDVIEVHPPEKIFAKPASRPATLRDRGNVIFHWLQLLNLGYRVPGVVNTDAHWNFHGSGWIRNYIKSPTDDPAEARIMDLVHAAERGQIVMTNAPFLEVTATAGPDDDAARADVGGDLAAPGGAVNLSIDVKCANWYDINRIQLFINGVPSPDHNYTRRTHPRFFSDQTVRFAASMTLLLENDAHLIVATTGEGLKLGRVVGPKFADRPPTAVTNPIFVDVDGNGFQANGDLLGVPLAEQQRPAAGSKQQQAGP